MHLICASGYAFFYSQLVEMYCVFLWNGSSKVHILGWSIEHSVANGSPLLQHFFESGCVAQAQWCEDGPANSLHTSIYCMKYNEKFGSISFMISFGVAVFVFFFVIFLEPNKFDVM